MEMEIVRLVQKNKKQDDITRENIKQLLNNQILHMMKKKNINKVSDQNSDDQTFQIQNKNKEYFIINHEDSVFQSIGDARIDLRALNSMLDFDNFSDKTLQPPLKHTLINENERKNIKYHNLRQQTA